MQCLAAYRLWFVGDRHVLVGVANERIFKVDRTRVVANERLEDGDDGAQPSMRVGEIEVDDAVTRAPLLGKEAGEISSKVITTLPKR